MSLCRNVLATALVVLSACVDQATEPSRSFVLPPIEPKFTLPPGTTPASFGLEIDTVGIIVAQIDSSCIECVAAPGHAPPAQRAMHAMLDTTYIDTLVPWPSNQESFSFHVTVPPPDPGFVVQVSLYYYSHGLSLFSGSSTVDFRRGDIRLPPIIMSYYGPGYGAEDIQIAPGDTGITTSDTLDFSATAYQNGLPLDTSYISWRVSDPTKALIDHFGHLKLRSGALGSSFLVIGAIPNGVAATTRVSVPNTVQTLQKVSGDSQSVPVGQVAPKPLVVRALDGGGKPVAGARIRFFPVVPPSFAPNDTVVFTDVQGYARTGLAAVNQVVGSVQAVVSGTGHTATFTATGTASTAIPLLFAADSVNTGWQLWRADSLGGNRTLLGYLSGTSVGLTAPRWNPAHNRVAFIAYNGNASIDDLLLTTALGDTTATLVSDSNASEPRFSPTGKMIAWVCHGRADSIPLGGVCTYNGADQSLTTLNGAANGAGRVEVTAGVPSRPNGPPAFAWRPGGSTRIAFVRDSVVDSTFLTTASRVYESNGDGTGIIPLSPKVINVGGGPLRIQGTMEWSPDGSTIVFSASDTVNYSASLYALDVNSGAVRRLTNAPSGWTGDLYPRFSPDGQRVLFRRVDYNYYYPACCAAMVLDYYIVRAVGGSLTRITYDMSNWGVTSYSPYHLGGDWSPDGLSVVITAPNGSGTRGAYRVPIDVTSAADYSARRILVGTGAAGGNEDYGVSWQP
jgi:Tol biopolymer transport system component